VQVRNDPHEDRRQGFVVDCRLRMRNNVHKIFLAL
jgi:hypothetical protein